MNYDVVDVEVIGDFELRLTFADGLVGTVDLADDLWGAAFEPLKDPAYFRQVRVDTDSKTIVWPNGLDLAPEVLYEGALAAVRHSVD